MSTRLREAVSALASDPSRAEAICRAIIAAAPDDRDARLVFVEALRRKGDLDAAMTEIAPLAGSDANWFAAQRLLGLVLGSRGEHARAAQALSRAATLNSAHAYVWRELADELRATGDTARSGAAYLNHIHMATVDPRLAQASQAMKEGQAAQARAIVEPYLAQSPTDPVALSMLAEIEAREDHPFEAEQLLRRIIDLVPDYLPARHNLSQLLMGLGKYGEALAIARYLVVRDPNNVGARKLLAAALGLVGEYASAADIYRRLLAEDASRASIWMALGHTMKTLGNAPEAIDAYRKAIALEPGLGEAYWSLANLKRFKFTDDEVVRMASQLERGDLSADARVNMLFALGSAREARGEAQRAFEAYSTGARLHLEEQGTPQFKPRTPEAERVFTPSFFKAREGAGSPARDPIFIVGLPRAGSTLVEQILASHSQVEGTMELPDLNAIAMTLAAAEKSDVYIDRLVRLSRDELSALGESYLQSTRIHRKLGRPRFIDKMPNNFALVGMIHLILPNARIVDVRRHPLACGWSCYKQHFAMGQLFTYDLGDIGRYYADYVALMSHFDEVLPGRVHRVIYEELVADPEREIRRLLEHCELPFEESALKPHETQRPVHTASAEQVRQPISASGLESWKPFEPWLGPLKEALGPTLDAYPDPPAH